MNKLAKHPGGRPLAVTNEVVKKLESIFKVGGTVAEACSYAGISKPTYYEHIKRDSSFLTKMEAAQHYADIVAKNVVVDDIVKNKDISSAKWWLEKREFKNANQTNVQVNVSPILGGQTNEIQAGDGDTQDIEAE
jgi:hypothetical protein